MASNTVYNPYYVPQAWEKEEWDKNIANQSAEVSAGVSNPTGAPMYKPSTTRPADIVANAIKSTNGAQTYQDGYKAAVDTLKSGQVGNNMANYTANENQRAEAEKQAIIARVKQAVQQGVDAQNKIINEAPAQYQGSMNQASYQGARNSQAIDERMASLGLGRSGSNITAQTSNNIQTSGNINALEVAKQKVINDARTAIANLQASGSLEEARQIQEAAAASLERIQAQQNIIDNRMNDNNNNLFTANVNNLKTQYDMGRDAISDARYADEQKKNDYISTISRFQNDYQAEINNVKNDGDASNDWQIPLLEAQRQGKLDKMLEAEKSNIGQYSNDYQAEINRRLATPDTSDDALIPALKVERQKKIDNKLQTDIQTIEQYGNDYQAEINRRMAINPNDPLIPYLKVARIQKLETKKASDLTEKEALEKHAMEVWKEIGVANDNVSKVLGVPVGSKTQDYLKTITSINNDNIKTNYETSKPYYSTNGVSSSDKPLTTQEKNQYYTDAYSQIKALSVSDAEKALNFKRKEIETVLGHDGFVKLYNDVLYASGKQYNK